VNAWVNQVRARLFARERVGTRRRLVSLRQPSPYSHHGPLETLRRSWSRASFLLYLFYGTHSRPILWFFPAACLLLIPYLKRVFSSSYNSFACRGRKLAKGKTAPQDPGRCSDRPAFLRRSSCVTASVPSYTILITPPSLQNTSWFNLSAQLSVPAGSARPSLVPREIGRNHRHGSNHQRRGPDAASASV
jgi:hypothetical protein